MHKAALWKMACLLAMCVLICGARGYAAQSSVEQNARKNAPSATPSVIGHVPFVLRGSQGGDAASRSGVKNLAKGKTGRIQFKHGRTTAVITSTVETNAEDTYMVSARAGQTMSVSIESMIRPRFADSKHDASFRVVNANTGVPLEKEESQQWRDRWRGQLPETGDYIINVIGLTDNTGYTLKVTVQ